MTLSCGHSLCEKCKAGLVKSEQYEISPAVKGWKSHPSYPPGSAYYETYRTWETLVDAKTGTRNAVRCPTCRSTGPSDALCVSVQLRASIGALFPAIVAARTAVKRLTAASSAAGGQLEVHSLKLAPARQERIAASAAYDAAKKCMERAVAAEAREAERNEQLVKKSAGLKQELVAAQAAQDKLEKEQAGPAAGQKRKR